MRQVAIQKLERLVAEVTVLHSKLILLVGSQREGASTVLVKFGKHVEKGVLNVGLELGKCLAALSQKQRPLQVGALLRELTDKHASGDLLLLNNIELLFDKNLQLDPLDLLKRLAQTRRVVAVWPGASNDGRLTYAEMGHPEHQDYAVTGFVPFEVK